MSTTEIPIDFNPGATQDLMSQLIKLADENPELAPTAEEVAAADGPAVPEVSTVVPVLSTPEPAPPTTPVPEVYEVAGSKVTVQKTKKGWQATLESGGRNPEIFYGATKDELFMNVMVAKAEASRTILDQKRKLKLTAQPAPAAPAPAPRANLRTLTADEVFEIKNQLATNPDLAFDNLFQKKTGLSLDQLVKMAERGQHADKQAYANEVAQGFMASRPDYVVCPFNYFTIVAYLSKEKLNQTMLMPRKAVLDNEAAMNPEEMSSYNASMDALIDSGNWTTESVSEAYDELLADELLDTGVEDEEEVPQVLPPAIIAAPAAVIPPATVTPAPPPAIADPRIASRRVGQRVGLGIRANQIASVPEEVISPSSDDGLEDLSLADTQKLLDGVRKLRQPARR